MHVRTSRILTVLLAVSLMLAMLPGAAIGENEVFSPKKIDTLDATALEILSDSKDLVPMLESMPQGGRPVKNAIPRRCISVRQGDFVTISVRVLRPTLSALADLRIRCSEKLSYRSCDLSIRKSSATIRLTFRAVGTPGTVRITYSSIKHPSLKRYTYVTIKKSKKSKEIKN